MTVLDVSVAGLNGIRSWEGRALRAYQDEVGVFTIGFGITNADKGIGFKVEAGVTITAEQAEQLLYSSLRRNYMPDVERVIQTDKIAHPQGVFDGAISFHYNTGGIVRASWPKSVMAGDMAAAKEQLESWNKAGGRVLTGLVRRRAWEWGVISAEDYGHVTGPDELDAHEHSIGTGELLTKLPGQAPVVVVPGTVETTGVPVPSAPAPGVLKLGSRGAEVIEVQKLLIANGFPVAIDGEYGPETVAQILAFQKAHPNLTADGEAGPATRAGLARAAALRVKLGKLAKAAPAVPVAAGGLWKWVHAGAGELVLIIGAIALIAAVVYVGIRYRAEVVHAVNKALGRTTV